MGRLAQNLAGQSQQVKHFTKGGVVKHDDVKQDTALIKKLIKKEDSKEMKCGGKVKK